jgi:hypothetical protein
VSQLEKLIKFCPELLSVAPEGAIREAQQLSSSSTPAKPSSNNKHLPSPIINKKSNKLIKPSCRAVRFVWLVHFFETCKIFSLPGC